MDIQKKTASLSWHQQAANYLFLSWVVTIIIITGNLKWKRSYGSKGWMKGWQRQNMNLLIKMQIVRASLTKIIWQLYVLWCSAWQTSIWNTLEMQNRFKILRNVWRMCSREKSTSAKLYIMKKQTKLRCANGDELQEHFGKVDSLLRYLEGAGSTWKEVTRFVICL